MDVKGGRGFTDLLARTSERSCGGGGRQQRLLALQSGGTFSKAVYRAVYKGGQLARRSAGMGGAVSIGTPRLCASIELSAPSAELSSPAPRCWESPQKILRRPAAGGVIQRFALTRRSSSADCPLERGA